MGTGCWTKRRTDFDAVGEQVGGERKEQRLTVFMDMWLERRDCRV